MPGMMTYLQSEMINKRKIFSDKSGTVQFRVTSNIIVSKSQALKNHDHSRYELKKFPLSVLLLLQFNKYCALHIIQLYIVHCTLYIVQFTTTVNCEFYTVHYALTWEVLKEELRTW